MDIAALPARLYWLLWPLNISLLIAGAMLLRAGLRRGVSLRGYLAQGPAREKPGRTRDMVPTLAGVTAVAFSLNNSAGIPDALAFCISAEMMPLVRFLSALFFLAVVAVFLLFLEKRRFRRF